MGNAVQMCLAANNALHMPCFSPSYDRSCVKMADRFASRGYSLRKKTNKLGDRVIKQLLNSVIAKYRDLWVSRRSIICRSQRLRQVIDLLATDKSRCFAQPRPIIVNYFPNWPWCKKIVRVRGYQCRCLKSKTECNISHWNFKSI